MISKGTNVPSLESDGNWTRLRDALVALASTPFNDPDVVREHLLSTDAEALGVERVSLWLFDPGKTGIVCVSLFERGKGVTSPGTRIPAHAASTYFQSLQGLLTLTVSDAQEDPRSRQLKEDYLKPLGIGAILDVPLRQFGELIGVLCHEHLGETRDWLDTERIFAAAMGALCSQVLEFEKLSRVEREREHALLHDQLTGLPNRALFLERVESARLDSDAALLVMDIHGLGELCKALGPTFGDQVLRETATRIDPNRKWEFAGRIGNDEFALLLMGEQRVGGAMQRATDLRTAMQAGMTIDGQEVHVRFGIGLVPSICHYTSASDALRDAEIAQNSAAVAGRDCIRVFQFGMEEPIRRRLDLEADIRRAIDASEFVLFLQPIFSRDGQLRGAEALIRWQHPKRGLLLPADFLEVAESTGLLARVQWPLLPVLFKQVADWRSSGSPDFVIAVNTSSVQLAIPEFPGDFVAAVLQAGLPPEAVAVEITENSLLVGQGNVLSAISQLAAAGILISLDDFGTGYASITHLAQLPLSIVKIDRSFVGRAMEDPRYAAIVETLIRLAHNLSLKVVVEGIETPIQMEWLSNGQGDLLQGFHLGRPASVAEFGARWLDLAGHQRPALDHRTGGAVPKNR
ncbi:MAG TPA: GGDEF domain-containing protein [Dokdonella sp.]|jgi:diguanylate cyclase (GGDEF)-like protein|nr:GGDEF domain-containing protein [Dokdonella sp.]